MAQVKVAVVGCGHWGRNHVRVYSELGALGAVVDPDRDRAQGFADQYGAPARSFEEVLAEPAIDAVAICAPAELHATLALRAFQAGKHVFVEKPIALTLADAEAMDAAGRAAGKVLMVGHILLYHPAFRALLEFVRGGGVGPIRHAYSHRLSMGKVRLEENVLWSFAPHDVSMLLALFDEEPLEVSGDGRAFVTPNVEDEYRVDLAFSAGRRAHVFASWLHPFKEHRLVVVGETGAAVFEDHVKGPEKLRVYPHVIDTSGPAPAPRKGEMVPIPFDDGEPLKNECLHFLERCAIGGRPHSDSTESIAVLRVLLRAGAHGGSVAR